MENTEIVGNPQARKIVLDRLKEWDIPYTMYEHPPLPTIEIALEFWKDIEGTHGKNLFLRNHKGNKHYLVVIECMQQVAIHDLEKMLKQGKLSFASAERMDKYLGLRPGSVSPFGLINDINKEVKLFLDINLKDRPLLSFHPNDNTAGLVVKNEDFMRYLQLWGGEYEFLELY